MGGINDYHTTCITYCFSGYMLSDDVYEGKMDNKNIGYKRSYMVH